MGQLASAYVTRRLRATTAQLVALIVVAVGLTAVEVGFGIVPLVDRLTATWTVTTADVVAQGTRTSTTRRGGTTRHRTVTVEYTVDGERLRATVDDRTARVGSQVPVWVKNGDPTTVELAEPSERLPSHWALTAVFGAMMLAGFWVLGRSMKRFHAMRTFTVDRAKGALEVTIATIAVKRVGKKQMREVTGSVVGSAWARLGAGAQVTLIAGLDSMPDPASLGPAADVLIIEDRARPVVVVRSNGADQQAWFAELGPVRRR